MELPAARDQDPVLCPHSGTRLEVKGGDTVNVNGLRAAKSGSNAGCPSVPSVVVTGSGSVSINGLPAARATDLTTDGAIIVGSGDVFVGGPLVSTFGSPGQQTTACAEAAGTRKSGSKQQSYGNCPLESWRNVVNKDRAGKGLPPVSEDELLRTAIDGGYAVNDPGKHDHGATDSARLQNLLHDQYGIDTETQEQTAEGLADAVRRGHAVSITIHPYHWGSYVTSSWYHEVAVTGVEYDDDGNVSAFYINDTGLGVCGLRLSIADYQKDTFDGAPMLVSRGPKW